MPVPLARYAAAGKRNLGRITGLERWRPGRGRLLEPWLDVLERAQPVTDALSRGTRALIEPIERHGWGDELLVYARRMI
jgi:hypothetical protein